MYQSFSSEIKSCVYNDLIAFTEFPDLCSGNPLLFPLAILVGLVRGFNYYSYYYDHFQDIPDQDTTRTRRCCLFGYLHRLGFSSFITQHSQSDLVRLIRSPHDTRTAYVPFGTKPANERASLEARCLNCYYYYRLITALTTY